MAANDCAFEVLGLERTSAIQRIIDHLSDPIVRRMVAIDYANNHNLTTLVEDEGLLREYLLTRFAMEMPCQATIPVAQNNNMAAFWWL